MSRVRVANSSILRLHLLLSLNLLWIQRVSLSQLLDFVVAKLATKELQFYEGNLIKHVVVILMVPVQYQLEKGARYTQMHRLKLPRHVP